jgi:hypothetical protein
MPNVMTTEVCLSISKLIRVCHNKGLEVTLHNEKQLERIEIHVKLVQELDLDFLM